MESEAPPSTGWYNFLGWLDVNKKRVAIGAAIVAVVAAAVALISWQRGQREVNAAEKLSAVRLPFSPLEPVPSTLADQLTKVAAEYPKTAAAGQATLRAAAIYYANGDYAKAQEQFNKFLGDHTEEAAPWVPQAQFGVAACLDAQNKTTEAIAKYNDYITKYPNDAATDEARFNLARVYEKANQPALAVETLNKMTNASPMSQTGAELQERLKALYAKHPNLVPTPPVPAPAPIAVPPPGNILTNFKRPVTNTAPAAPTTSAPAATPTPVPAPAAATPPTGAPTIKLTPPPSK